ncbi:MAG: S8 family serine peptidase [Solirubrobacteraceae bacterium]
MHRRPRFSQRAVAAHVALAALAAAAAAPSIDAANAAASELTGGRAQLSVQREAALGGFAPGKVVVGYARARENAVEAGVRAAGGAGARAARARGRRGRAGDAGAGAGGAGAGGASQRSAVVALHRGETVRAGIARLRRRRGVRYVVPDYVAHAASSGFHPNDPGKSSQPGGWEQVQWNFAGEYGVGAPLAWEHLIDDGAPGGAGTIVAVLDTGVAYENRGRYLRSPDFEANEFVPGYDFVANNDHPDDQNGHGTFVAGTIAEATNNGVGLTGLAYGAKIMPVRVLDARGEGEASTIAKGVRFAVNHGAQVINLSLVFSASVTAAEIPELLSAIAYAHAHGVVLVAAAGNNASTDVPYPARDRFVISVGASTEYGCLASYSDYGPHVDIVAPGGGSNARLPQDSNCSAAGTGRDVFQETFLGSNPRVFGLPGGYEGTSMAAPDVSATAALVIASGVLGAHPSPAAVRYRLEQTARPLGGPAYERDFGHGLLDAAAASAAGGPGAVSASRRQRNAHAARRQRRRRRRRAR